MKQEKLNVMGSVIDSGTFATPCKEKLELTSGEREELVNMSVKEWYHKSFPKDPLWKKIVDGLTFYRLFQFFDRRKYSYRLFFADDSIVRERIMAGLAKIMEVPYDDVYRQWLDSKEIEDEYCHRLAILHADFHIDWRNVRITMSNIEFM